MATEHGLPVELWRSVYDHAERQRDIAAITGLEEARFRGAWTLDADASLPLDDLQQIVRTLASQGSGELHILVSTPDQRQGTIEVRFDEELPSGGARPPGHRSAAPDPEDPAAIEDRFVDLVLEPGDDDTDVEDPGRAHAGRAGGRLRIEPSPELTLQDLVDRLVDARQSAKMPEAVVLELE